MAQWLLVDKREIGREQLKDTRLRQPYGNSVSEWLYEEPAVSPSEMENCPVLQRRSEYDYFDY